MGHLDSVALDVDVVAEVTVSEHYSRFFGMQATGFKDGDLGFDAQKCNILPRVARMRGKPRS